MYCIMCAERRKNKKLACRLRVLGGSLFLMNKRQIVNASLSVSVGKFVLKNREYLYYKYNLS